MSSLRFSNTFQVHFILVRLFRCPTQSSWKSADQQSAVGMVNLRWTAEEDKTIISLHLALGDDWQAIRKELPGRPNCRRYFRHKHPDLYFAKKTLPYSWTSDEDRVLTPLRKKDTPPGEIPFYLPDRDKRTCRGRWFDHLLNLTINEVPEYEIAQRPWTTQEEQTLIELRKANKSWLEIWKAPDKAHTYIDCRTHWFDYFWDEFNKSIVNGEIDLKKLKEGNSDRALDEIEADDVNNGAGDADGETDSEEEYGDADPEGDIDYEV